MNIMRMSKDTSMAHPWGKGDFAVGVGYPTGSGMSVLECVGVEMEHDDESVSVSYSLKLWLGPDEYTPGWGAWGSGAE